MDKLLDSAENAADKNTKSIIRFSTEEDKDIIKELITLCFGDRTQEGAYERLASRYLLCLLDNKLVAITGLVKNADYRSKNEISWTCTHPDYRHRGLMIELFKHVVDLVDGEIYCSCWKLPNKDKINLCHLMEMFDFELILEGHIKSIYPYKCSAGKTCPFYNGEGCTCQQDLYVRKGKQR